MGLLGFKEIMIIAVLMLVIWSVKSWNAERKKTAKAAQLKRRKGYVQSDRDTD
jgi:hypothetical protein